MTIYIAILTYIIANIIGLAYDGGTPFQAEVYFINLAKIIQAKIAVPYFDVFDPRFPDFSVPVAVRGTLNFKISNYRVSMGAYDYFKMNKNNYKTSIKVKIVQKNKNSSK